MIKRFVTMLPQIIIVLFVIFLSNNYTDADEAPLSVEWAVSGGGSGTEWRMWMCMDSTNHICISGNFANTFQISSFDLTSEGLFDGYIAKLKSDGEIVWLQQLKSTAEVKPANIAGDKTGNYYFTGMISGDARIGDIELKKGNGLSSPILIKLNSDGDPIWGYAFNYSGTNQSSAHDISIDGDNNVYITGHFDPGDITFNNGIILSTNENRTGTYVAKFDSNGICQWANPIYDYDGVMYTNFVRVSGNNVFALGKFNSKIIFGNGKQTLTNGKNDIFLACYSKDGNLLWTRIFGGTQSDFDQQFDFDTHGNIIISGNTESSPLMFDKFSVNSTGVGTGFIVKLDSLGNCLWANTLRSKKDCSFINPTHDSHNNIYVTSEIKDMSYINNDTLFFHGSSESVLSKFSPEGERRGNLA